MNIRDEEDTIAQKCYRIFLFPLSELNSSLCNPNLLDNPWFTVNQRNFNMKGDDFYYGFDRWYGNYRFNNVKNIPLLYSSEYLLQPLEESLRNELSGKTVTVSVKYMDDNIESVTFVYDTSKDALYSFNIGRVNISVQKNTAIRPCAIGITAIQECNIKAVKLELGSISTIAMDTTPNYQQELAKCQRYYQRIKQYSRFRMSLYNTNVMDFDVPIAVPFRSLPSILNKEVVSIYATNTTNTNKEISDVAVAINSSSSILIRITSDKHGLTDGCLYVLNGDLEFSADL